MKVANNIIEWLIQSGTLAVLVAFLWAYAKPLLTAKAKTAKTEQSRQLWTLAEQVAEAAVNTMASRNLSGADKYAKAVDMVQTLDITSLQKTQEPLFNQLTKNLEWLISKRALTM